MDIFIWNHLREVLKEYAEYLEERTKQNLIKDGHVASGTLVQSIKTDYDIDDHHYEINITMEDYWKWVNDGRKAGKYPPIDAIKEWVKVKRIMPTVRPVMQPNGKYKEVCPTVKQLPYAIAGGIKKNGIEATHFFDDAKMDASERFRLKIEYAIAEDIGEYVSTFMTEELKDII